MKQRNVELELENRNIRESKVKMQVKVEQEEEYISNMLLKRIQKLKTDKELLALKYEQEEEFLTNDLMRKLLQVSLRIFTLLKHSFLITLARIYFLRFKNYSLLYCLLVIS